MEFKHLLRNWACHLQRAGIAAVVWALDLSAHRFVQTMRWRQISSVYTSDMVLPAALRSQVKVPGSDSYLQAVLRKPMACARVLAMGFSVLFVDVDVVVRRDPRRDLIFSHADVAVATNYPQPLLNSGVLYLADHGAQARSGLAPKGFGVPWLVSAWLQRTRRRHACSGWACGDQEQLTALLKSAYVGLDNEPLLMTQAEWLARAPWRNAIRSLWAKLYRHVWGQIWVAGSLDPWLSHVALSCRHAADCPSSSFRPLNLAILQPLAFATGYPGLARTGQFEPLEMAFHANFNWGNETKRAKLQNRGLWCSSAHTRCSRCGGG
uniref:Nucleotide-diphospho-sugar transferase domain-containing protein n=1 Tax=Calcidiscus leptoporus TaxID=127549 RepID=A0A7S0JBN9_9EUKA